jgi:hypothetical protein
VKNANEHDLLLFTGVEKMLRLACYLCTTDLKIKFENRLSKLSWLANAGARSKRDVVRGHIGAPSYAPYPRRVRTPRCRNVQRSLRCTGVLLCMTSTAARMVPSGEATLAGAPPVARHWPLGQPHVVEHCHPHRACSGHWGDLTSLKPTSHDYINKSPTAPRARTPPSAIGAASVSSLLRAFTTPSGCV